MQIEKEEFAPKRKLGKVMGKIKATFRVTHANNYSMGNCGRDENLVTALDLMQQNLDFVSALARDRIGLEGNMQ